MTEQEVEEWLKNWADENLQEPGYYERKVEMKPDAVRCREEAKAAGIGRPALLKAAGGDLEAYLLGHQNAFTDSEVQRKADKDD